MAHPTVPRSRRARMWLSLKMYCVAPRVTSEPRVPPQHVTVFFAVLLTKSLALLPEEPSTTGGGCALPLSGTTVTVAIPLAVASAWDTAVMFTVVVIVLPRLSDFVGTALGATY